MRRHVTPDQIRRIKALGEQGHGVEEIASRVGLGKSTVHKVQQGRYDRRLHWDAQPAATGEEGRVVWCSRCRCNVYPPCQMCRLREHERQHPEGPVPIPSDIQDRNMVARLQLSVAEIGLSVRIVNLLQRDGIYTVNDLLNRTTKDLLDIPSFGRKSLAIVFRVLGHLGFVRKPAQVKKVA